jgi:hypothetical protein
MVLEALLLLREQVGRERRPLMPGWWQGHPLRKEHPARRTDMPPYRLGATPEQAEEEKYEIRPEEFGLEPTTGPVETMLLNCGPHHPGTHGLIHFVLQLEGERIRDLGCQIGCHHRAQEKTAERQSFHTYIPYPDRIDYLAGFQNELPYVLAVEKLAGIEVPPRAQAMRVLLAELFRIANHLVYLGTFGADLGSMSPVLPPPRLPGVRRGRRVPPAGHDRDDRSRLPPLPWAQADLPDPGPRPLHHPRDEPQPARLREGVVRGRGAVPPEAALAEAARRVGEAHGVVGVGSGRASLEANHALKRLVGVARFATGLPAALDESVQEAVRALCEGPARAPAVRDVETADAVLLLAADPTNEAPRLDLALRRAVEGAMRARAEALGIPSWNDAAVRNAGQGLRSPLFVIGPAPIKLEAVAADAILAPPDESIRLCEAITSRGGDEPARRIGAALFGAKRPLVMTSAAAGVAVVRAAARLAYALCAAGAPGMLSVVLPEADSLGVALLGGRSLEDALAAVESGTADTLVVVENDLARWLPAARLEALRGKLRTLVALDCVEMPTTRLADVVVPASPFAEEHGTFVSQEGRAQRYYPVLAPPAGVGETWSQVAQLGGAGTADWASGDDVARDLAADAPALARIGEAAPPASFRIAAMKIAREPHRASGRTAIFADRTVFDPPPTPDEETPFSSCTACRATPASGCGRARRSGASSGSRSSTSSRSPARSCGARSARTAPTTRSRSRASTRADPGRRPP